MEWTDEGTFSLTFKTDNAGYDHVKSWVNKHMVLISAKTLPNTTDMINNDPVFKKLVKNVKVAQRARDEHINKNL